MSTFSMRTVNELIDDPSRISQDSDFGLDFLKHVEDVLRDKLVCSERGPCRDGKSAWFREFRRGLFLMDDGNYIPFKLAATSTTIGSGTRLSPPAYVFCEDAQAKVVFR